MRHLLASALALCLSVSVLSGCTAEKPANTTDAAQTGLKEKTMYLLTMLEEKNNQGEVISSTTYTYDDRGFVMKMDIDQNWPAVWNEELGFYESEQQPCDGVVDIQEVFAYDEHGNPTKVFDESYEYTYDNEGKITAFTAMRADYITDHQVEYDAAGNAKIFKNQRGSEETPALDVEIEYDEAGRIVQITHYEDQGWVTYQCEYNAAGKLAKYKYTTKGFGFTYDTSFSYDDAGRVEQVNGDSRFEWSYQYEDDMLVAINNKNLITTKQESGVLTVQYGDYVLTYTPVVLDEQDADLARNRWNLSFGPRLHDYVFGPLYVRLPMSDIETVLLLPKQIF